MASSSSLYLSTFVSIILIFFCTYTKADLIANVCSKSSNPPLCNQVLRSDPRSAGADLRGLGQIAIDKSRLATQVTSKIAKSHSKGTNKGKADTCVEVCSDAIDDLNDCVGLINKTDRFSISTLQTRGSAAISQISTCDDDEWGSAEPTDVKQASQKAHDLIDVLLVIANSL